MTCPVTDTASALGCMYVIEGATLGGKIILKHIADRLELDEHSGAAFFHGFGTTTGSQWKAFLEIFSGYIVSNGAQEAAIHAASCLFSSIDDYFSLAASPVKR